MPREFTYPITINDREFLYVVAAYKTDGVTIPELLAVKGLADSRPAIRAMYQTAERSVRLHRVEKFFDDEPPKRELHMGSAAIYLFRITEAFAPELLELARYDLAQANATIKGLKTKFDF